MKPERFEPFFLAGSKGRLFALIQSQADSRCLVLFVPPFGEEMNKSRRQYSVMARQLVEAGFAVLRFDLFGTGDSEGEFADACWQSWKDDINCVIEWAHKSGYSKVAMLATRMGCPLLTEVLSESSYRSAATLFVQPVSRGSQFYKQFLRLRVAASMMKDSGKESVDQLQQRIDAGETVEVSGYPLTSRLTQGLNATSIAPYLTSRLGVLHIAEVARGDQSELSPAMKKIIDAAKSHDIAADGRRLVGEPFWTSTEIVVNDELAETSVEWFRASGLA